jgi:hypothetical protein
MLAWVVGAMPVMRFAYNDHRFRRRVQYRLVLTPDEVEIDRTPDNANPSETRLPRDFPGLRLESHHLNEAGIVQTFPTLALSDGRLLFQALDRPVTDEVSGTTAPLSAWLSRWWQAG